MPPSAQHTAHSAAVGTVAASTDTGRRQLRNALAQFPTGVVIATAAAADGALLGMTLNSFTSVSLEPPLVLFCIDRRALSLPAWELAPGYAINFLAERQRTLSNRFARAGVEKWSGTAFVPGLHGAPLLHGAVGRLECTAEHRVEGGDHVVFVGRIERHWCDPTDQALVFYRGRYAAVAGLPGPSPVPELASWPLPIHY